MHERTASKSLIERVGGWPAALALVLVFGAMAYSGLAQKSATFDEPDQITVGYSQWTLDDYRLEPSFRALPNRWSALPLLALDLDFPPLDEMEWVYNRRGLLTDRFVFRMGNDAERILRHSRGAMTLLGMALGLTIYAWSRRLFGTAAGLLSAGLFAFSPTMLAHGALATSDTSFALFILLAVFCLWNVTHRLTLPQLLASSLAVSGVLLTKASGLLIVPLALALVLIRWISRRPLSIELRRARREISTRRGKGLALAAILLVHAAVALTTIWGAYGFRYSAFNAALPGEQQLTMPWNEALAYYGPFRPAAELVRDRRLLPEAWLYGLSVELVKATGGPAFLNGKFGLTGWRSFFPYAFAVKTAPPLFAVLFVALLVVAGRWSRASGGRRGAVFEALYHTAPLWLLFVAIWAVAIPSHLNIGHRHILAVYPPLFILAGAALTGVGRLGRFGRYLAGACAVLLVFVSLSIRPHYLAYFNFLAGGPSQGYRHLVDSSLDWGQDLPALGRWIEENVEADTPVFLSYFGSGHPEDLGVKLEQLPSITTGSFFGIPHQFAENANALRGGVYCISATMLQRVYMTPRGPWTEEMEQLYRSYHDAFQRYLLATQTGRLRLIGGPEKSWKRILDNYRRMRFVRLCLYLLEREPVAHAGYSILIYRLTDEEALDALIPGGSGVSVTREPEPG